MPERQCQGCTRQADWGCEAELTTDKDQFGLPVWKNPANLPLDIDGEPTFACPRQHIHRNPAVWSAMLKYYGMYKQGFLPQPGAVMDQSNYAVEVFRVFDDVNYSCDQEALKNPPDQQGATGRKRGDPFADRR